MPEARIGRSDGAARRAHARVERVMTPVWGLCTQKHQPTRSISILRIGFNSQVRDPYATWPETEAKTNVAVRPYRLIQLNSSRKPHINGCQDPSAPRYRHTSLFLPCGSLSMDPSTGSALAPIGGARIGIIPAPPPCALARDPAWSSPTGCREDGRNAQGEGKGLSGWG